MLLVLSGSNLTKCKKRKCSQLKNNFKKFDPLILCKICCKEKKVTKRLKKDQKTIKKGTN